MLGLLRSQPHPLIAYAVNSRPTIVVISELPKQEEGGCSKQRDNYTCYWPLVSNLYIDLVENE